MYIIGSLCVQTLCMYHANIQKLRDAKFELQLFTVILIYCRIEMRSCSSDCSLRTLRNFCQLCTLPLWDWRARDSVSYTEDPEVFLSPSTIKDTYLTFWRIGESCFYLILFPSACMIVIKPTKLVTQARVWLI